MKTKLTPFAALALFAGSIILAGCSGGEGSISNATDSPDATVPTDAAEITDDASPPGDAETPTTDAEFDAAPDMSRAEFKHFLYVAETDGDIHVYGLEDPARPAPFDTVSSSATVTFGAFHPELPRFYTSRSDGLEAFEIVTDVPASLETESLPRRQTHLDVTPDGAALILASYGGDEVTVVPLNDGLPQAASQTFGAPDDPFCDRAHQVRAHPGGRYVYVPCLGSDHIAVFEWDGDRLLDLAPAPTTAGMGPRHLDFHPTLDRLYVIGESNSTVEVFDIDTTTGALTSRQTISTMANGSGSSASSDIHVSPDGQTLYAMNRQPVHDLAVFSIDADGELDRLENIDSGGEHSRSFALHPDGGVLYAGHQDTQNVSIFTVDTDGTLTPTAGLSGFDSPVWFVGIWTRLQP